MQFLKEENIKKTLAFSLTLSVYCSEIPFFLPLNMQLCRKISGSLLNEMTTYFFFFMSFLPECMPPFRNPAVDILFPCLMLFMLTGEISSVKVIKGVCRQVHCFGEYLFVANFNDHILLVFQGDSFGSFSMTKAEASC